MLKKLSKTSIADFDYDHLVVAFGCTTNYFGNTEIEKHIPNEIST
jgi:NADH dehydrogenase